MRLGLPLGKPRRLSLYTTTQVEDWQQHVGNLRANPLVDRNILTNWICDVGKLAPRNVSAKSGKIVDRSRPHVSCEARRFGHRESAVQERRGPFEHGVAMSGGHGKHQVGARRDTRGQLASGEVRCIASEALQHQCGCGVDRVANHCSDAGARYRDTVCAELFGICDGKALCGRRSTDVASADE